MEHAIQVRNLTKSYKDFTLDHISFDLPSGTIMGLIGENGAGKSTLINAILGISDSEYEQADVLGYDITAHGRYAREDVAAIFCDSHFDQEFTPLFLGKMLSKVYRNWDQDAYMNYLERFDLPLKKQLKKLSTGMRVKVEFAVALSHNPKLLVLDEATSGLDPVFRDELLDLLREFTEDEDHSVFISSHITSDLDKIADMLILIDNGRIVFQEEKDT